MNGRQDPLESGRQLLAAWEAGHDPESLDAAISVLGQALAAPLPPPEAWPPLSWELGKALSARIGLRPDADDTDRLIEVLGDLIGVADQPGLRQKRGQALMKRHRRTSSAADLDAAIADFDAAFVALGEDESGQMYEVALDLSWALESRFDVRQGRDNRVVTYWDQDEGVPLVSGPPDLVRPIFVLDHLLDASGWQQTHRDPPPPELAWRMKRNLANLLRKFAAATVGIRSPQARAGDAARAIELLLQARNEMPPDSNEAGTVLVSLLAALQNFPEPDPTSRDELVTALEDSLPTAPPGQADLIRLNLAELRIAQNRVAEGVSLYRALISPGESGAESMGVRLLAADRWAFSALRRAAWEEVLDAHAVATSLTAQLRVSSADWDDRYRWSQKTARVATAAGTALVRLGRPAEAAAALQAGRALEVTERLGSHAIGGAQRSGTSIYLLSTPGGTDALHRTKGADWATVPLPGLAPDALLGQAKPYVNAFDAYRRRPSSTVASWLVELERMVDFLGAGLRSLRQVLPAGDVTIVPMGLLSILPVGTAFLDTSPTRGVSIVPTLARRAAVATVPATQNVVIADPALTWAQWEAAAVSALLSPVSTLAADASPQDILAGLPAHGIAHFACHATLDLDSPLASRLDLPGGRLTVGEVLHSQLPPLALVVLSACETGLTDPYQFDEGIAFPAAFIAATGADVLSTQWKVNDLSTSLLVFRFYWEWRHELAPGPQALALAQQWQRSTTADEKCDFLTEAQTVGVLTSAAADTMASEIRRRANSGTENPFAHPYHWAGFNYAS